VTADRGPVADAIIRDEIRALAPYHVADATGMIKLDAMENPFGLPDELRDKWLQSLARLPLNRYPDASPRLLKDRLHEVMGIDSQYGMVLGNGSDEIIQMLCMAVAGTKPSVLAPVPGFVMYDMIATFCRLPFIGVSLTQTFELDVPAMLAAIKQHQPAQVFLAYPNNPTGNLFDEHAMAAIIQACPGLVVVDEAYYVFAKQHALQWLADYPHMLLMRTLSKLGLAGIRLGFISGAKRWIQQLDKVRLPYNINALTQASALFMLEHWPVLLKQADIIVAERELLQSRMQDLGVDVYPSQANFVLFRVAPGRGKPVFEALKGDGILVKCMPDDGPLKDCLRVTVGTDGDNAQFIHTLRNYV